ncbi:MAG: DUF4124 domain-containing protein [Betaproteobacteria bacterium]|nr:DUF4124 domain-containing protein [Betaproteobacteria bacterium]
MMHRMVRSPSAPRPPTRVVAGCLRVALVMAVSLSLPAAAALYKWTDANGRVVYSDQPPPGDVKSERLQAAPPPANPHAVREMANQEAELKKRQQERTKQAEDQAKLRADASKRAADCTRAETQARALGASQQVIYRFNEKGERVALDDAARIRERQELERWMKANNCGR